MSLVGSEERCDGVSFTGDHVSIDCGGGSSHVRSPELARVTSAAPASSDDGTFGLTFPESPTTLRSVAEQYIVHAPIEGARCGEAMAAVDREVEASTPMRQQCTVPNVTSN